MTFKIVGDDISDGYHTFGELYAHRIELWIALCRTTAAWTPWRARLHSDGSSFPGWFLLGIGLGFGEQITYHLPESRWDDCAFAQTLDRAPEFDGHSAGDVLKRLATL